jgi:hypothetical protein
MGLFSAITGAVSAVSGIFGGRKASKTANRLSAAEEAAIRQQMNISQEQWDRHKEMYWPFEEMQVDHATQDMQALRPIKDQMFAQAERGEDPQQYMDRAGMDVRQAFGNVQDQQMRQMQRMGVSAGSGQAGALVRRMGINQALAEAGARTGARQTADDLTWSRRAQALNFGQGMPMMETGAAGMGQAAAGFGNLANRAAGAASQNYGMAGYALNRMAGSPDQGGVDWSKVWGQAKDIGGTIRQALPF